MSAAGNRPAAPGLCPNVRQGIPVVLFFTVCAAASGAEAVFTSGAAQTALVELFTSEGCSSCPPAEGWLAARRTDPGLWRDFVPVAWHVTYWDGLGWPDRFAQPAFTDRQRAYAARWRSESVYTPCFVRNGREWRPDRSAGKEAPEGVLRARYEPRTGVLQVEFAPVAPAGNPGLEGYAALLGGGVVAQVRAGENAGGRLEHEFVALAVARSGLALDAGVWRGTLQVRAAADPAISRRALAVWVTRQGELGPLQAVGGWLDFPVPPI